MPAPAPPAARAEQMPRACDSVSSHLRERPTSGRPAARGCGCSDGPACSRGFPRSRAPSPCRAPRLARAPRGSCRCVPKIWPSGCCPLRAHRRRIYHQLSSYSRGGAREPSCARREWSGRSRPTTSFGRGSTFTLSARRDKKWSKLCMPDSGAGARRMARGTRLGVLAPLPEGPGGNPMRRCYLSIYYQLPPSVATAPGA